VPARLAIPALVVLLSVAAPGLSMAQMAGVGTGTVMGVVRDAEGLVMSGVDVTISGRTLIPPLTTTTRRSGEYRFAWLPPGDYVLTFTSPGFDPHRLEAHVSLAFTLTLDATLKLSAQAEAVVVRGSLDRHSAILSQSFDARTLNTIPGSRSLAGLFAVTPALSLASIEVGGGTGITSGFSGAYGRIGSPRHTVEGIVVTGLFGAGFSPDYGAFEEVSVLTGAYGAEWPTVGIHTDITTKSGSNQYRGSLYGAAEHRRLQSSNVDADQILRGAVFGGGLKPGQVNQLWRNADGNADIGGFLRKDRVWWYASIRRQEVASRLVNFPAAPYLTTLTNVSGKVTARLSARHRVVLYGQRGTNHQPYRLDPFSPAGGGLSAATAINESTASTINQHNSAWLWKAEWNAALSDSWLVEVRAGQWGNQLNWKPRSAAPRFEDIETSKVWGGNRNWQSDARRNQFFATASYFAQNRTGRHNLRIGAEALRFLVQDTWFEGFPGNVLHVTRSGRASSVYLFSTPSTFSAGVWSASGYVSDAWQIGQRITVTPGLRFDRYWLFLPAQSGPPGARGTRSFAAVSNVTNWNMFAPRLGVVFDINGHGRTLAKMNYGRYRAQPNANSAFNANPNTGPWWVRYAWTDTNGSGVWEPGESGVEQGFSGGETIEKADPNLALPMVDELGTWIEHTLPGGITFRAGAVWRLERFQTARQNLSQLYKDFSAPVAILDRGLDGVAGTGDDGPIFTAYDLDPALLGQPASFQLQNVPGSSSEFLTWEIATSRQLDGRWGFGASFAYTWNGDHASNYAGQTVRNNPYPLSPNDLINAGRGGRLEFSTWTAKLHGTFEGPWQMRLSPLVRHQSGQPFGRTQRTGQLAFGTVTMLMEPIGSRRMDNITLLDIRLDRAMRLMGGRVSVYLDVFNVLNANPEQNVVWLSGPQFLRPLAILPPRIARIGVSFDW